VLKIGVLLGDDIGLEVVPEAVKCMKAAAAKTGMQAEWIDLAIGKLGHEKHGDATPKVTLETLATCDGWICGPIGHNAYPRNDPTWVMPPLRKKFELFANVKPVKSYANLPSIHKDVDIVFLRETTEGMMSSSLVVAGAGEFRPNDDISIGMRVVTRKGASRVAREAFEIARTRKKKIVTCVHKEPVYRLVCGMFAEEHRKLAKEYPDVTLNEVLVDGFAMKLVMKPQQFDVVVTTNQFGDILTDEGAGLVGGLGLAPGLVCGEKQAMAQATHGSAHRRQKHRQPLRDDYLGQDAARMAGPQAQRPESHGGRKADRRRDGARDRRRQASHRRSGRQGKNHGDGRRRGRRHEIINKNKYLQ
jgi:3-isopropylmalate dehydrogenase